VWGFIKEVEVKYCLIFFFCLLTLNVYSNNIWITQRPSEFTTASGGFIHVGTRTRGYAMGTEQTSQGNSAYCFVMLDGINWSECSPNLVGGMKFVIPAKILPDGKMVGVIQEFQGFNQISSFIHSEDLVNFIPVSFFDQHNRDDTRSSYPRSLEVIGDTVWLGTKNGKIKKSSDLGYNWNNITVSNDTDMQISVIIFKDEMNGIAGGGVITEGTDWDDKQKNSVEKKGTLWRTSDGGETWNPIVENLEIFPLHIIETSSGRIFLLYWDNDTVNETSSGSKRVVWSDDQFATFTGSNESFDVFVPSGKFSMGSALDMDGGDINEIWVAGYCGAGFNAQACTIDTKDGGDTWWEKIVPDARKLGPISVLDSNHVYIAGEFKAMYKWGDPNEDFSEPEEPEEPDFAEEPSDEPDEDAGDKEEETPETTDETETKHDEDIYFDDEGCSCSVIR
jgi:hypothetical protein